MTNLYFKEKMFLIGEKKFAFEQFSKLKLICIDSLRNIKNNLDVIMMLAIYSW